MLKRCALPRLLLVLVMIGALLSATVGSASAGAPPNRLDDERSALSDVSLAGDLCNVILPVLGLAVCPGMSGRVLEHPEIHNIFAISGPWDPQVPDVFSEASINQMTKDLLASTYLDAAAQYGVQQGSFIQSTSNDGCTGAPDGTTDIYTIQFWITCEVEEPGTGIDWPNDNSLYVIYLPPNVDVKGPTGQTCDSFDAYHFQSLAATPGLQSYPYIVIPTKCAGGTMDGLTDLLSHELVEASVDPIVPHGWIDSDTIDLSLDFATKGEAADICSGIGAVPTPSVRLPDGQLVATYWSNADNACAPVTHTLSLSTSGLPGLPFPAASNVSYAYTDGMTSEFSVYLPDSVPVVDGVTVSWTFPSQFGTGTPGVAYVTDHPVRTTFHGLDHDLSDTATYYKADQLTVTASPDAVAALDPSLSYTKWVPEGDKVELTAPTTIDAGPGQRYRFDHWSTEFFVTDPTVDVLMDKPQTATAVYVLQQQVTFDQTGLPPGTPWTVTVNGATHAGPSSDWFDVGSALSVSFEDPVAGPAPGTRYTVASTSPTSPLTVTAGNGTVTATYSTQRLLTVTTSGLPDPNVATITNSGAVLGTVNDTTPLDAWLDSGTALSLAGDAVVSGTDGTQYFAQSFVPAPPATLDAPVTTTLTYATMDQIIGGALSGSGSGGPGAQGQVQAFSQQFAAVQRALRVQNYATALDDLTAFINHVEAQRGKKVAPAAATTLDLDALLVYHSALCSGVAVGQLSAAQASNDYSYYADLVTTLGGTMLPACASAG